MTHRIFFSRELNDYVVDARCRCGHLRRHHGSKLTPLGGGRSFRDGSGGSCRRGQCDCDHFRWNGWVTATQMAASVTQEVEDALAVSA